MTNLMAADSESVRSFKVCVKTSCDEPINSTAKQGL